MGTSGSFYGNIDLNNNSLLNNVVEKVITYPSSPVHGRLIYHTGINKPAYFNGNEWVILDNPNIAVPIVEYPLNIVYVSNDFTDNFPFFSSIPTALSYLETEAISHGVVVLMPGDYTVYGFDLNKTILQCMDNTTISSVGDINIGEGAAITGNASIQLYTASYRVKISGGDNSMLRLQAKEVIEGNLNITGYGRIELEQATGVLINSSNGGVGVDSIYIKCGIMHNIQIDSSDCNIFIDTDELGYVRQTMGNTIIHFKSSTYINGNSANQIQLYNSGTKRNYLKLIEGRLSHNFDSSSYWPVYVGGLSVLELQHVWMKNNHGACIYIDNTTINTHLLKVDNCVLLGNPSIDSALVNEAVYCYGSWAATNVSLNINMILEPINVGAIW